MLLFRVKCHIFNTPIVLAFGFDISLFKLIQWL